VYLPSSFETVCPAVGCCHQCELNTGVME
jgi:hypothetical protein